MFIQFAIIEIEVLSLSLLRELVDHRCDIGALHTFYKFRLESPPGMFPWCIE